MAGSEMDALGRIDHLIVLMLENRSFDHILGYLGGKGMDVNGLEDGMKNRLGETDYPVYHLTSKEMQWFETPEHGGAHVDRQLEDGNGGFARDYIESRPAEVRDYVSDPKNCVVMGYHDGDDLRVFDHLAHHYCVCDRWFSSVRGATMPNRLYSIVGESSGRRENKKLFNRIDWPLYNLPSFARYLDQAGVSWRWYHAVRPIPGTLRIFDPHYLVGHSSNFALFDQREILSGQPSFLEDARANRLPAVSWIDPGFFNKFGMRETDDHPPMNVDRGQLLVAKICDAVMSSPCWPSSLLVITYDEHGGFFDHVEPPPAADDYPDCAHYGVRVPAIIVSPFVAPGQPSHMTFDHTSLIRTILDRFTPEAPRDAMGTRVEHASNLSSVIDPGPPRLPVPPSEQPQIVETLGLQDGEMDEPLAGQPDSEFEQLLESSVGGLDFVSQLAVRDETEHAVRLEALGPFSDEVERPLDELQLGLLAAAGDLRQAEQRLTE